MDYILIYRRRHSNIVDARPFRTAYSDNTDLVVANTQRSNAAVYHGLKKLNKVEGKERHQVKKTNCRW
jgi:hypothetical protein